MPTDDRARGPQRGLGGSVTVETHVHRARARTRAELEATTAKVDAYGSFVKRVERCSPRSTSAPSKGARPDGGIAFHPDVPTDEGCRAVLTAFEETVHPHSADGDEPVGATLREEFTDSVAGALAPTTDPSFTDRLKCAVLTEAKSRRAEERALRKALRREIRRLDDAVTVLDEITDWITEAEQTPLTDLGFEALRDRHRELSTHRERCETLARDRQGFLGKTTNEGGAAGVRHRRLVAYLYVDFPVDHPVLSTVTRLDATCADCQRAVRDHLVRRV
jgi:hypothetical protein